MAYTNPGWTNGTEPAINEKNLNDISNAIVGLETATARMVTTENGTDTVTIGSFSSGGPPQRVRIWVDDTANADSKYGFIALEDGLMLYKSGTGAVWALRNFGLSALSTTYTSNTYVTSANFSSGFSAYRKMGMLTVGINLNITTALPSGTVNVQIGTISGWSAAFAANASLAGRSGGVGNLVLAISTAGVITIGNGSGTACSGQYRTVITVPVA